MQRPHSSTDRMRACGVRDVGSIPAGGTMKSISSFEDVILYLPARIVLLQLTAQSHVLLPKGNSHVQFLSAFSRCV